MTLFLVAVFLWRISICLDLRDPEVKCLKSGHKLSDKLSRLYVFQTHVVLKLDLDFGQGNSSGR